MFVLLAFSLFVVIVTAGAALSAWARTADESDATLERRLALAAGAPTRQAASVLKDQRRSTIAVFDTLLASLSFVPSVERSIRQAGLRRRAGEVLLYVPLLGCIGFLASLLFQGNLLIALAIGAAAGSIPLALVRRRKRVRAIRFAEQLPDALDLIRAALQAGHSFATALTVVAAEFPDPIAEEFREVSDETRLGLSLREALHNLKERIDDPDLPMLIIGVLITEDSGGNLAEVLDNIGHTVRERFKMSRDVRTMTAQGRLSGLVLTVLPFLVGGVSYFLNPTFFSPMIDTETGRFLLGYAMLSILAGHLLIRRIAHLDV